jgi:molybdopterin molybdotransferase
MIGFREAYDAILKNISPLDAVEVDLEHAYSMVLAEDVYSDIDIPPFDKSAMDGFAVRSEDLSTLPAALEVGAVIPAGPETNETAVRGSCVRIMTGAPVPPEFDAVVMFEETEERDGRVVFKRGVEPGQNICPRGEDVRTGKLVLSRGSVVHGPEIATLASVGRTVLRVHRKPRVGILSTGSEVIEPDQAMEFGLIRNSNGPMLASLVRAVGAEARYLGIGNDRESELTGLVEEGLHGDMLLISGGVSMGDYDLIPQVLKKVGVRIELHRVRIKPGKPLLFARRGECVVIGVPGNPVSNFTTFHVFIKHALYRMMGRDVQPVRFLEGRLKGAVSKKGERAQLMPSIYRVVEGEYEISPLRLNGSADIIGCAGCNSLLFLDEGEQHLVDGARAPMLLIEE